MNAENFDLVEDSGRLGGAESGRLTDSGRCYSRDIARYLLVQHKTEHVGCDSKDPNRGLLVLAGGARVHSETLLHLQVLFSCYNTALLNELRGGDLHMLSKEEIKVIANTIATPSIPFLSFISHSVFLFIHSNITFLPFLSFTIPPMRQMSISVHAIDHMYTSTLYTTYVSQRNTIQQISHRISRLHALRNRPNLLFIS